ncbi:MAG: Lamin Tail Domain [Pseudomonadota bacterium]|jgi:hypothetical protein
MLHDFLFLRAGWWLALLLAAACSRPAEGTPRGPQPADHDSAQPRALPAPDGSGADERRSAQVELPTRSGPASADTPPTDARAARIEVRISEVFSDPLLVDDPVGEFVELTNLGATAVIVDRLELLLPSGRRVVPRRPEAPALAPCEALVVRASAADPAEASAGPLRLPNRAGQIELYWRGRLLDRAVWTGRWPWPKHRAGRSLERRDAAVPGDEARAWRSARTVLRRVERASPGRHALRCAAASRPGAPASEELRASRPSGRSGAQRSRPTPPRH